MADDGAPIEPRRSPSQTDGNPQQLSNAQLDIFLAKLQANNDDNTAGGKDQSLGKQTSLLHQSSSYLKQATSGFMRWQSRRAFWSAMDKSRPEPKEVRVALDNTRLAVAYWLKTVASSARRHPSVLLVPLLLGCACMAGGLAGVISAAEKTKRRSLDSASHVAAQAASSLELLLSHRGLQPVAALAGAVRQQPNASALGRVLPDLAPRLWQPRAPGPAPLRQLLLAPFGAASLALTPPPPPSSGAGGAGPLAGASVELNTRARFKAAVDNMARGQTPTATTTTLVAGPSNGGAAAAGSGASEVFLACLQPVLLRVDKPEETWGNEVLGGQDCGTVCHNASTRTKLWGFTGGLVSLSELAASTESGLGQLAEQGFRFRLTVRSNASGDGSQQVLQAAVSTPPPSGVPQKVAPVVLGWATGGQGAAAEGELVLYLTKSLRPAWEGPLIAIVVLVSLALTAVTFATLHGYWRHMDLLRAMLPDKVISVLGRGSHYYQHFNSCTLLYADVVRYTAAQPQQGEVPSLEVVKLLNDVHAMYESIIEKYGLVRIRRSGESFLVVGGCPTPEDPTATAVRVASCARDLLLATSRFRGAGGFRVQIRVGLHTGPVVAAVVGSKTPRFSLFGDAVDVAYYMEATSKAMAVHVSETTSQLLAAANDPLLPLRPRGRLDIIGQGSMHTNWLQLQALPDQPADGEQEAAGRSDAKPREGTSGGGAAAGTV